MKKYVAISRKSQARCFCRYTFNLRGVLIIEYFMPKSGFSVIWVDDKTRQLTSVRETVDGRYTIVTIAVHPSHWLGPTFKSRKYLTVFDVMDDCFGELFKFV